MPSFPTLPAMRSGLDAQINFLTDFTHRTCDSLRKLNELNLQYAQQMVQDSADASRSVLSSTDPYQLAAAFAKAAHPASEHLRLYQQNLFGVLSGAQLELVRSADTFMPQVSAMAREAAQAGARFGNGSGYTPA